MNEDFKSKWRSTDSGFAKTPDGTYEVTIHDVKLTTTKQTGKPMFAWDFILPNNQHYFHNRVIDMDREFTLKFAKLDFENLGLNADDLDELELIFPKLIGCVVEIKIETKGTFQNCTVLGMIKPFSPDDVPF